MSTIGTKVHDNNLSIPFIIMLCSKVFVTLFHLLFPGNKRTLVQAIFILFDHSEQSCSNVLPHFNNVVPLSFETTLASQHYTNMVPMSFDPILAEINFIPVNVTLVNHGVH